MVVGAKVGEEDGRAKGVEVCLVWLRRSVSGLAVMEFLKNDMDVIVKVSTYLLIRFLRRISKGLDAALGAREAPCELSRGTS